MTHPGRIIIHAGAPKTGSTYLQKRLRANRELLLRHGVYVPVIESVAQMAGNAKLLATVLSRRPSLSFQRVFPHIDTAALKPERVVAELLADWRPADEAVILSAENFRPDHAPALRRLLPASAPCVIVLFVRRQDLWIESYFNQLTKTAEVMGDLPAFVTRLCETEGERFCRPDWHAHYEAWGDAFGDCRIVFYDEVKSDVFSAFLAAAEIASPPCLHEVDRAQVSLDVHQLAYLLSLNSPSLAEFAKRREASAAAARRLPPAGATSILGNAERALLQRRFQPSNDRLLRRLGRSGDSLLLRLEVEASFRLLEEIYASEAYVAHRDLSDAIFAGAPQS
jgi:hypothetical protein